MSKKLKVLDLFSGVGGFSLGLERAGMETVAFCEYEEHAQKILKKHWPNIPIYKDVRELDGKQFRGTVDVVTGGFPCQDLSVAGKKKGFEGERSSLYREMLRIVSECRPRYAIFENVTGLLTGESGRWFAKFLYDLAEIGYDAEWHCVSASFIGAPHHRDRVWVIAYPYNNGQITAEVGQGVQAGNGSCAKRQESAGKSSGLCSSGVFANTDCQRGERFAKIADFLKQQIQQFNSGLKREGDVFNLTEPGLCRTDDGVSGRLDRARARKRIARLGNAVVPQIPQLIGEAIIKHEASR